MQGVVSCIAACLEQSMQPQVHLKAGSSPDLTAGHIIHGILGWPTCREAEQQSAHRYAVLTVQGLSDFVMIVHTILYLALSDIICCFPGVADGHTDVLLQEGRWLDSSWQTGQRQKNALATIPQASVQSQLRSD